MVIKYDDLYSVLDSRSSITSMTPGPLPPHISYGDILIPQQAPQSALSPNKLQIGMPLLI